MIDTKDRPHGLMTYAAEENLEVIESDFDDSVLMSPRNELVGLTPISHPLMQRLFKDEAPDAGQHIVHDHVLANYTEDF